MKQAFSLYLRLISIQLRSQMQYRVSFWLELVSTALLNATFFLTLALVLERFGQIGDWKLADIAYLAGMVEMSFATMDMVFAGFDPSWFSQLVRLGTFDQFLLRPVNITLQIMGARFELRRLGRIFEGLVIFGLGLASSSVQWTLAKLIYLPIIFISQVIAFGALFMGGSALIFWTVQPVEAVNIATYGGNEMMTYPMHIYPEWMRSFFTFVIPFIFMNYYPALYILDKPDPLNFPSFAPFLAPLVGIGFLFLGVRFWNVGINHYQSTGS